MLTRTSKVESLIVKVVSFSSTLQIGDVCFIDGTSTALAIQRETEQFYGTEGDEATLPVPPPVLPITENLTISKINKNPLIKVGNVNVLGVSSSSILGVGNVGHIRMQVKLRHIRHLENDNVS
ncbi:spore germination protein GerPE [Peribacillus alkalitolerans]|uniref:spore germination protein GerPE n=1 Tax=Peribacillus alkalitolerans TaxID=1550385 RepID=UPI0013D57AE2|nr:spore germination protein GerPE [Peribacillus alkalitolerans]